MAKKKSDNKKTIYIVIGIILALVLIFIIVGALNNGLFFSPKQTIGPRPEGSGKIPSVNEYVLLSTSSCKIYMNDSINNCRGVLTKTELPNLLADGMFSGNVQAKYNQRIELGSYPILDYSKAPTSANNPNINVRTSSSSRFHTYKTVINFYGAVDFTSRSSKGKTIRIFGKDYIIGQKTNNNQIELLSGPNRQDLPGRLLLYDGGVVTRGENDIVIDGTRVELTGGTSALKRIVISIRAPSSDQDAILEGGTFLDPVFGRFNLNFANLNIEENSAQRENIEIKHSGDDKMTVRFTPDYAGAQTITFAKSRGNYSVPYSVYLEHDEDGHKIHVLEMEKAYRNDYIVIGNENEGRLLKVYQIANGTTGYANDTVKFLDVFSGNIYETLITTEGQGTVSIGGKVYAVYYYGAADLSDDLKFVRLDYPDSAGSNTAIIYPTIATSKGAKLAFYEPLDVSLANWDGRGHSLTSLKVPNGNGFSDISVGSSENQNVGILRYSILNNGNNVEIRLLRPDTNTQINEPALIIFEERDDNRYSTQHYQAMVVTLEPGATGDDGLGVDDVIRTWSSDGRWDYIQMPGNSRIAKEADLWGSIVTTDGTDSDQKDAIISYPNEQIFADIYARANY